jgi:tRNA nucleotidyltransferase/poly(A) polymerase
VLDFVGGGKDLAAGIVRTIGDPEQRFAEDKLRMLRAVRFAARFDFTLEERTLTAIRQQAHELVIVSAERVAAELRLILTHTSRVRGLELLAATGLLEVFLPESTVLLESSDEWSRSLAILTALDSPKFSMALAALLRELHLAEPANDVPRVVAGRWKLSTDELTGVEKFLREEPLIRTARQQPWPKLQRILITPRIDELLGYCEAVAKTLDATTADNDFCREKLSLPPAELNPPPLITGDDLKALGIPPGPAYRDLLEAVRDAQLSKQTATKDEAVALAICLFGQKGVSPPASN